MIAAEITIPADIESAGGHVIEYYLHLLDCGQSESMAGILAMRKAPGLRTEATQIAAQNQQRGGATLAEQFKGNENLLQYRIQQARKHGYSPKATDYYDATLVRPEIGPGDPRAWIGSTHSLSDVKREMSRSGDGLESGGKVAVKRNTDVAPEPPKKLAEHIVDRIEKRIVKEDPKVAMMDRRERRSMIKDKHGSSSKDAVE